MSTPPKTLALYEAGIRQMSVTDLMALATTLRLNPIYFFGDADDDRSKGLAQLVRPRPSVRDRAETLALVKAYRRMPGEAEKHAVRGLVKRFGLRVVN